MFNVEALKQTAQSNDTSKAIFNELSTRQRSRHRLNLRKLKYDLMNNGINVLDKEYIETFKALQELGVGKMVSGRLGNPTRFVWKYKLKDVVDAINRTEGFAPIAELPKIKRQYNKKLTVAKIKSTHETPREKNTDIGTSKSAISITFNLSPSVRMEDLGALISLAKELESK